MRRGIRIPAWYLLLVAVLGILSGCQSLWDLERFADWTIAQIPVARRISISWCVTARP